MTLVCFTNPWGFVDNSRDERNMLKSWREGLVFFGFAGRFRFFRDVILKGSLGKYFLPETSDDNGMGYLMRQADREVSAREQRMSQEGFSQERPDFLQLFVTSNPCASSMRNTDLVIDASRHGWTESR